MATFLVAVIYAAFIGLGLPDSLFGTAWPSIYTEYGLPIALGGTVSVICFLGTFSSSLLSTRMIRLIGTAKLTAFSTLLTAVALLGFGMSKSFWMLLVLAIPLGLGAGSVDAALNNYVAVHYSASMMSFLHCFYGVGVTISPFILTMVFKRGLNWRNGYLIAGGIQIVLAIILILSVPIWSKVNGSETDEEEKYEGLTIRQAASIKGVKVMWLLFAFTCAIEMSVGNWSSTFLVEYRHMDVGFAASAMTFYYLGMTLGRLLSGLLAKKLHSWQIIKIGLMILPVALILLLVVDNGIVGIVALMLIGLGNGPMFPNFNYLAPENFGESKSPAIIGTQMAAANISIVTMPVLCGILGQIFGMVIFPYYLILLYILMLLAFFRASKIWKMPGVFKR